MKRYFIETSVIIDYLKGDEQIVESVLGFDAELISSFICLSELYEGIYRARNKEKVEEGILTFFKGLSEVFGVDQDIATAFGKIRAELKREGKVIEDIDIFLAATCLANNLAMVTKNNKHFERVTGLKIVPL